MNTERTSFTAESHSAITVVSAFATGKGVTIGIDLPCKVTASVSSHNRMPKKQITIRSKIPDPHNLVRTCVDYSLRNQDRKLSASESIKLVVDSQIPVAVGLKSSSAVSVATVKSVLGLLSKGKKIDDKQVLKISCSASKDCGASLTGAYDDAAASLLGGLVFSNNTRFRMISQSRLPAKLGSIVKLLVPLRARKLTSSVNRHAYFKHKKLVEDAYRNARNREIAQAMLLNSMVQCLALGYSIHAVTAALSEGASASGITGKGPGVSALCSSPGVAKKIEIRWLRENPGSKIISACIRPPTGLS